MTPCQRPCKNLANEVYMGTHLNQVNGGMHLMHSTGGYTLDLANIISGVHRALFWDHHCF